MSHKCRIRAPDTAYQPDTAAAAAAAYIRPYQADTTLIRRISNVPDACLMPQPDTRPVRDRVAGEDATLAFVTFDARREWVGDRDEETWGQRKVTVKSI